ncbi:GNAT family N-acetyltransferase [Algibacter pacificus]|uniref:GNAT family N-acetyltransferase n=1 Tax=Algibacter pacificus TaxID=2599389 RepID=UPI0011C8ABF4|nr:GNAT family N-acetyltransferase [Algibacter pacificus]
MKKQHYYIKQIIATDTHSVRHPVLRPGKPIESCFFDGDNLDTTIHFGIYDTILIGVCSILKKRNPNFTALTQYQLRGMAVLKPYQGLGVGKELITYCDSFLKKKHADLIWCNAREIAVDFYKKNGYHIIGNSFHIKNIGPHFTMKKNLTQ